MFGIKELIFYRSGEVVRDLGLVYLHQILKEKDGIKVKRTANYLKVNNLDKQLLYDFIIKEEVYKVFLKGVVEELKKKIDEEDAEKLVKEISVDDFLEEFDKRLDEREDIKARSKDSLKKKIKKSFKSKYFPYVRNSPKYGYNAQSEDNFHNNFKELVRLVIELNGKDEEEQLEVLKNYEGVDRDCFICRSYKSTKFDVTHKNNKKERINSKYDYLFMGSQNNTYNNFFKSESSVCFVCEFLNLMALLYFSLNSPRTIAYTDNLINLEFINYKVMLKERNFSDKGLYRHLAKYKNQQIQLYETSIDSNKGVILEFTNNLRFDKLLENLKLYDLVDRFYISQDSATKRAMAKDFIKNKNKDAMEKLLLNELLVIENSDGARSLDLKLSKYNIRFYLELLELNNVDKEGGKELRNNEFKNKKNRFDNKEFKRLGRELGKEIGKQNKKGISFKLIQMMKSENREGLWQDLTHLIVANQVKMPRNFADSIIESGVDGLHYQIGGFLEEFINTKTGGEDNNE